MKLEIEKWGGNSFAIIVDGHSVQGDIDEVTQEFREMLVHAFPNYKQEMYTRAVSFINSKRYQVMSTDYELWETIHEYMGSGNAEMPFDCSFDEFVLEDENEALLSSRWFQLSMLLWIEETLGEK